MSGDKTEDKVPTRNRRASRLEIVLIAGLLICILALYLYRLETWPAPWFDEGLSFQAARNIAREGQYGLRSTEGLTLFHPAIQTGPTVLLPVALALRLAGAGVFQARLVMVFYALLALAAFYGLVRETCRRKTALLALLLLLFTFDHEFTSFVFMGRQVLAEVPALAFFWLGALLWFRAWKSSRRSALIGPGLLWGLTLLTKIQFVLMLPAALLLFWLFARISGKKWPLSRFLLPLAISGCCLLLWYGYQSLSMGWADFWRQATTLGSAGGMHFLNFSPQRTASAILQLSSSPLVLLGAPAMLYVLASSWQQREEVTEYQQAFLATFTAVWLGWYAFLSIGWMRYAFVPTAMSTIFTARLLGDLWEWTGQRHRALSRRLPLTPGQVAVGGVIAMLLLSGAAPLLKQIVQSPDSGLQALAQYLNAHVPADAVIESWEWEVDLLTDHAYHHPPYQVTNAITAQIWYGASAPPDVYDPLAFEPTYLLRGPFAKWTGIYSPDLLAQRCTPLASIGDYDLYRVNLDEEK